MFSAAHYVTFSLIYFFCFEIITTNSRTSNLWRLSPDNTKIIDANPFPTIISMAERSGVVDDEVFNIITSTVHRGSSWVKDDMSLYCDNCEGATSRPLPKTDDPMNDTASESKSGNNDLDASIEQEEVIDCGKPVNFTYYDNLVGVANRNEHPNVPEPQLSLILKRSDKSSYEEEINLLERRLRKAKKEKPKSVQLYSQIGNFWRIKGDSQKAIECFRRALAVSPHNSEVLLNLARVLFSLQYLDDAIYLTRRSLETRSNDKGAWQQYFTLGEIFKAYGHYQEATLHLQHALELKPGFQPALVALTEMQAIPVTTTVHVSTVVIILSLVLGVLFVILSSRDEKKVGEAYDSRGAHHRHLNRSSPGLRISKNNRLFRKLFG